MLSWQTRSLAMVIASSSNPSEELARFAANLTIDADEYEEFNRGVSVAKKSTLPVNASTQETAVAQNFDAAADRNNFDMLALFGMKVEQTPPGQ